MVHHQRRERVVVEDGHAVAFEYSSRLGRHNLIRSDFEKGAVECFEFKWRHGQCVQKANVVLVAEVVTFSSVLCVGNGGQEDSEVASKLVSRSVALAREEQLCAVFHAGLNLDFTFDRFVSYLTSLSEFGAFKFDGLGAALEKFFKSALAAYQKISSMGLSSSGDGFFVNIVFNLLRQLDLAALIIESDAVRVGRSKEVFKDFESVSTESVGLLAHKFTTRNSVLENLFSVPVIGFSELRNTKNFESLTDLAEFEVDLSHSFRVLVRMIS